jgi:hypothetical protein
MKAKAQSHPFKALIVLILRMGAVRTPLRVKNIPALASRRATNRPSERRNDNWPQASVTATYSSNQ